ncbi:hypothetical protein [Peribacillus frigoritolerans]|uniref:hypothetical protein n=1 Tax=Peribacillus frigoritolerans TaxID=450367 RepID=UPI00227FA051|nr:hypothetical protein [Peribacillus frigoritolerans]MCY9002461.1 hypothetical protein [Peribacillus frigoritolerans]
MENIWLQMKTLLFLLPENIDIETAVACPIVSLTSYRFLDNLARLVAGERVHIYGAAGVVGITAIQLAEILSASRVIGAVENGGVLSRGRSCLSVMKKTVL